MNRQLSRNSEHEEIVVGADGVTRRQTRSRATYAHDSARENYALIEGPRGMRVATSHRAMQSLKALELMLAIVMRVHECAGDRY
jgi:hypothetical protein